MNNSGLSANFEMLRSRNQIKCQLTTEEAEALAFLLPLSADYPGIDQWYFSKVIPGLRTGTRFILPVRRDGGLIGLGIAKSEGEKKICTVRVAPTHVGRGAGVRIFEGLMRWLDNDRPHLTVSDGKLPQFERIFDYYGYNETSKKRGLYVPSSIEHKFNEPSPKATGLTECSELHPAESRLQLNRA